MSEKKETCLFREPWIGPCQEPRAEGSFCCEKHSQEKCQVCGEQATTRCQASIGLMCGVPLCSQCGHGEMCLDHATSGPVMVIAALLGRGPSPSVFASRNYLVEQAEKMKEVVKKLKQLDFGKLTMEEFDKYIQNNPIH